MGVSGGTPRHAAPTPRRLPKWAVVLVLAVLALWRALDVPLESVDPGRAASPLGSTGQAPGAATSTAQEGADAIRRAFAERRSGFMVTLEAELARLLPDDREGSAHQRFLLRLPDGHSLLVAHNIDLAPRVPLGEADRGLRLRLRGQYEWNAKGGVLHWTHHDPDGRHPGGWIEHRGQRYE